MITSHVVYSISVSVITIEFHSGWGRVGKLFRYYARFSRLTVYIKQISATDFAYRESLLHGRLLYISFVILRLLRRSFGFEELYYYKTYRLRRYYTEDITVFDFSFW